MMFREAKIEDFQYMKEHTINPSGQKWVQRVDYVYALEDEGKVLGIGGFSMVTDRVAWVWIDMTPQAQGKMLTSYRVIRDWMATFVQENKIIRLMAFIKNVPEHIRLAEHLGFVYESKMERFFPNEDALMYKRIYP